MNILSIYNLGKNRNILNNSELNDQNKLITMIDALRLQEDVLLYIFRFFSFFLLSPFSRLASIRDLMVSYYFVVFFLHLHFAVGAYFALILHRNNRVLVVHAHSDIRQFPYNYSLDVLAHPYTIIPSNQCITIQLFFFFVSQKEKMKISFFFLYFLFFLSSNITSFHSVFFLFFYTEDNWYLG